MMEKFFLQHSTLQDREPDELGGRVHSDSEASETEGDGMMDRVHSVADPTGPWKQTRVHDETWGRPKQRLGGAQRRAFASMHTGPKGVRNDYHAHQRYEKQERERKDQERQAVLTRMVKGAVCTSTSYTQDVNCQCDGASDCECDTCAFMDDTFMAQYTERRLQQLQQALSCRRVYGDLHFITPEEFVTLTSDNSCRRLLVHLYDADNSICRLLNTQLEQVARKLVHIKFVAMVAKEADATIARADLPVVLIVHNDQQHEAVVDVARRLDGDFTLERVEAFVNEQFGL